VSIILVDRSASRATKRHDLDQSRDPACHGKQRTTPTPPLTTKEDIWPA
jgi:hypothetical protein